MEPTVSTSPPAGDPAADVPAQDFGWTRAHEPRDGTHTHRVVWTHPGLVAGAFRVWASAQGVSVAGQFFLPPSLIPNLRAMLALAARVSRQLASGVKPDALDFAPDATGG